jgi:hypothetical protein
MVWFLVFAGPATPPAVGVMETRHMPLASVMLHDTRAGFLMPCSMRTDVLEALSVTVPRVAVAVDETLLRGVMGGGDGDRGRSRRRAETSSHYTGRAWITQDEFVRHKTSSDYTGPAANPG